MVREEDVEDEGERAPSQMSKDELRKEKTYGEELRRWHVAVGCWFTHIGGRVWHRRGELVADGKSVSFGTATYGDVWGKRRHLKEKDFKPAKSVQGGSEPSLSELPMKLGRSIEEIGQGKENR